MKTLDTKFSALLSLVLAAAGCESTYVDHDSSLDRWCGDALCDWTTEQGEIAQIHTWHDHEYGVELVTPGTAISHLGAFVVSSCMRIRVLSDVDTRAQVSLDIDVGVDGTRDHNQRLTGVGFERSEFIIPFAGTLSPVKFTIRKDGVGKAKIAEFQVDYDDSCQGLGMTYPDGSSCFEDVECTSGACIEERCSECGSRPCADGAVCKVDAHCSSGSCVAGLCDPCGADASCVAGAGCDRDDQCALGPCLIDFMPASTASTRSAAQCAECTVDAQCADGFCVHGGCATCRDDADCAEGTVCGYPGDTDATGRTCLVPHDTARARGALCERDADCADGLRCGADEGLAPRCGYACASGSGCGEMGLCWAPERAIFGCKEDDCADALFTGGRWLLMDPEGELARATTCYSEVEFSLLLFDLDASSTGG